MAGTESREIRGRMMPKFQKGDIMIVKGGTHRFEIIGVQQKNEFTYTIRWLSPIFLDDKPGTLHIEVVDKLCRKLTKLDKVLK
jgi:hypothetical protein